MGKKFFVTKASGAKSLYDENKLIKSLKRSGASVDAIESILKEIHNHLHNGISTREIYNLAFQLLKNINRPNAARYNLKRAIMAFGPSGFPFEKYIGEILKYQGYKVEVGVFVQGLCVQHEVDIVAERDNEHFMIECKFHNQPGTSSDVKIPLYINSRFLDIEKVWKELPGHTTKYHQGWVVTNTRFTDDAIKYGTCAGLNLLGWNYPEKNNLRNMIDESGLHPITALTTLSIHEKDKLLTDKIVLCKEIYQNEYLLNKHGIEAVRIPKIIQEAENLCEKKSR